MCIYSEQFCECGSWTRLCKQQEIDFNFSARVDKIDQGCCIDLRACKDSCPIDGALMEIKVVPVLASF